MKNGAKITRVFHKSYHREREQENDVEELFFLTQRFPRCIFQEDCLNAAINLAWEGFSCRMCPISGNLAFAARPENLKGRIPFEI